MIWHEAIRRTGPVQNGGDCCHWKPSISPSLYWPWSFAWWGRGYLMDGFIETSITTRNWVDRLSVRPFSTLGLNQGNFWTRVVCSARLSSDRSLKYWDSESCFHCEFLLPINQSSLHWIFHRVIEIQPFYLPNQLVESQDQRRSQQSPNLDATKVRWGDEASTGLESPHPQTP